MDTRPSAPGSAPDRPAFPTEAVTWLVGNQPRTIAAIAHADLAAALAAAGHQVAAMTHRGRRLPFGEQTLDAVVAADRLPEPQHIAELLRPGGTLALVCNHRDHKIPWARKLDGILGQEVPEEPALDLVTSRRFGFVEEAEFRYWQLVNKDSLTAMLASELGHLDPAEREQKITAALELYDDYGRGADGMQMPWVSRCFRAGVVDRIWSTPQDLPPDEDPDLDKDTGKDTGKDKNTAKDKNPGEAGPADDDKPDDGGGTLLIDFH